MTSTTVGRRSTAESDTSALFVGLLGIYLSYIKRRAVVDENTGEDSRNSPSHYLFFRPVEYWAIILPAVFLWTT